MSEVFVQGHFVDGMGARVSEQITLQINEQIRFRTDEQITLHMNGQISRQMSRRIKLQMIACEASHQQMNFQNCCKHETKTHSSKILIFVKVKDFPTGWAFWRFPKIEKHWKFWWFFLSIHKVRSTNQTPKISNGFEACQLWPGLAAVFWVTTGGAPHPTRLLSKIHPLQVLPNRSAPSSDLQVVLKCSPGTVLPK